VTDYVKAGRCIGCAMIGTPQTCVGIYRALQNQARHTVATTTEHLDLLQVTSAGAEA